MSSVFPAAAHDALHDPARLLDRDHLRAALSSTPRSGEATLREVDVEYVRAKRGVSAMLGLALTWETEIGPVETRGSLYLATLDRVRAARAKSRSLRLVESARGPSLATIEEPAALFLAFPNDRALRGLSAAADPRRLKNRLHRLPEPFVAAAVRVRERRTCIEALRWKPGRRAVLRARLGLRHADGSRPEPITLYLRVYARDHLGDALDRWRVAARWEMNAPRVLAVDAERGFFVLEALDGRSAADGALDEARAWPRLAERLARLYRRDPARDGAIPHRSDRHDLAAARRALGDLSEWAPGLAPACRALASRLGAAADHLSPAPIRCTHGDLTADQVLIHGDELALIDWDEASIGDPHADLASLAADLETRSGSAPPESEELARGRDVLGSCWDERRARWHRALAAARRCLAGLQRGSVDWRAHAERSLATAEAWMPRPAIDRPGTPAARFARAGRGPAARSRRRPDGLRAVLAALLSPAARRSLTGVEEPLALAAVWPDGEGAIARFEDAAAPRTPRLWLRVGTTLESWMFPSDPALTSLETLVASGRYEVAGHRLARRAALRDRVESSYLYLRPIGEAERAWPRVARIAEALARSGVACPAPTDRRPEGWRARALRGAPLDPRFSTAAMMNVVGATLARVHRIDLDELPVSDLEGATHAAARQVGLVRRLGSAWGDWLGERLDRWASEGAADPTRPRLVHGDLHPAQILLAGESDRAGIALIDWERAHRGDPAEDLGNLLAHLALARDTEWMAAWRALATGYRAEGGEIDAGRTERHARLALLRLLAIHSWRDAERERCLDRALWERRFEELRSC